MDSQSQEVSLQQKFLQNEAFIYPFFRYVEQAVASMTMVEDESTYEKLLELEGTDEDRDEFVENNEIDNTPQLNENQLKAAMENENWSEKNRIDEICEAKEKAVIYKREELKNFETLVDKFYAIDSTTMTNEEELQIDKLLDQDMTLRTSADVPQILIYHTHASESYADSVPGDLSSTVIGAGEELKNILTEKYGYSVLHDTGIYDTVRAQAYNVAAPNLERILSENPSIEVVIDLHRDQVQEGTKLVSSLNGVPAAKFMFFNGLSRTKETGNIEYLKNDYRNENLAFAFQMQLMCNEYYPDMTRKIYLKGYRYNMQYRGKTLLIELGAQTNTSQEAKNACYPIAHALHMVLSGEIREQFKTGE